MHPTELVAQCIRDYMLNGKYSGSQVESLLHQLTPTDTQLYDAAQALAFEHDKDGLFIVSTLLVITGTDRETVCRTFVG